MKRLSKSLLLVALLFTMALPAWSQTSTQGKEFWVALIPSSAPGNAHDLEKNKFDAYIAISAPKACTVTVSNPNTGWSSSTTVGNNSWTELKTEITPGDGGFIPIAQWYTQNGNFPANEQALNHGLKVTATEEVSVFCSIRWEFSMDATNILPINAVQKDYIVQSYDPNGNDGTKKNNCTILAAEDCTVTIQLACRTDQGTTGTITQNLQAGKVYHIASETNASLSGTKISSTGKIAVFTGSTCANVPATKADRDLLYEQLFPLDYWGQNFVVVRTKEKDANRVIITAQENNTDITIYGTYDPSPSKDIAGHEHQTNYSFTLNSGQSYEFEMSVGQEIGPDGKLIKHWDDDRANSLSGVTFVDSAIYIKTSCPCAVLTYDVGSSYIRKDDDRETQGYIDAKGKQQYYGAPSMTWVSPIEQMINDIVFGVMGTDKTTRHFVNIVMEARDVPYAKLNGRSLVSYFKPVECNTDYSYARIKLSETDPDFSNPFYHLESKYGFVATVYGNGDDESYAYSVGSSAVKRAIAVDGYKFTSNMPADEVKQIYCINEPLVFNPQIGMDVIDTVFWNFGDGTTDKTTVDFGTQIEHTYYSPGWYDITALVYAHRECPEATYPAEEVAFSFYVNRPDTFFILDTLCLEKGDESRQSYYDTVKIECDSVVVTRHLVMHKADTAFRMEGNDKAVIHGKTYYDSRTVIDTLKRRDPNNRGCDSIVTIELIIRKCLNLQVPNDSVNQHTCFGSSIEIPYTYATGGQPGDVRIVRLNDMREFGGYMEDEPGQGVQPRTAGMFTFNTSEWEPGLYKAKVYLEDLYCKPEGADKGESESGVLDIAIYYPGDIFDYRFNNVLAVFKKGYGGNGANNPAYAGADFDTFEWHLVRNEIDAIVGANASVYYNGDPFLENDIVYVRLKETTKNYMLPSCSQTITVVPDFTPEEQQQAPAAQKRLVNNRMVIIKDDCTYNMYGQRVQ